MEQKRVIITSVTPQVDEGLFPIKRTIGDSVEVEADIFTDGHSRILANLLYRKKGASQFEKKAMRFFENDRFEGSFFVETTGFYEYTIEAWIDRFGSWQHDFLKKFKASVHTESDILVGLEMIKQGLGNTHPELCEKIEQKRNDPDLINTIEDPELHMLMKETAVNKQHVSLFSKHLEVMVEPVLAKCSAWYEFFPRSCSKMGAKHATLKEATLWLDHIEKLGFDTVYLPPIHPIGNQAKKGKNNSLNASQDDPGSPWAIGNHDGGHKAIHQKLGSFDDFDYFVKEAKKRKLQVALDIALQCSPDHPYIKEHPEWFVHTPDGKIQHAENPPKKYEDIVPFNFETDAYKELYNELLSIFLFWIEKGITVFRVDNPHTKPFCFWHWLIRSIKLQYPEVIFLSEAFTRPKVMHYLAKLGFSQSYTYFTWRDTKKELADYLSELTKDDVAEYFRPNFWPNTPDILPISLQTEKEASFISRLVLAATLSSNYGIYGPPFEMMEHENFGEKEEYLNAEKYEIRSWDLISDNKIRQAIREINAYRKENKALQQTKNIEFLSIDNEQVIGFIKKTDDESSSVIVFCNLDPENCHSVTTYIDLLGKEITCSLDPGQKPYQIIAIEKKEKREESFDYY